MTKTEALLNLVWAMLCAGGLGFHFWRNYFRQGAQTHAARVRRTLSVLVAAVALFPCISATDDRVRLGDLDSAPITQTEFASVHASGILLPILEDPEHGQTVGPMVFTMVASFCAIVRIELPSLTRWFPFRSLGRAPPLSLA